VLGPYKHRRRWRIDVLDGEGGKEGLSFPTEAAALEEKRKRTYEATKAAGTNKTINRLKELMAKDREREHTGGYVYFANMGSRRPIKIGFTKNLTSRLGKVRRQAPYVIQEILVIPGSKWLEYRLHDWFRRHNSNGEWFKWNDQLEIIIGYLRSEDADEWEGFEPHRSVLEDGEES